jgi:hypothetical protein
VNISNYKGRMSAHLTALLVPASIVGSLLLASPVHAAPDLDILASAGLGDDLGGRPVAIDLLDDGVVLASEHGGQGVLVRLDRAGERSTSRSIAAPATSSSSARTGSTSSTPPSSRCGSAR